MDKHTQKVLVLYPRATVGSWAVTHFIGWLAPPTAGVQSLLGCPLSSSSSSLPPSLRPSLPPPRPPPPPPCGSGSSTLPLSRPPDRCMVAAWMPVTETHLKLYSCHRSCSSRPCLPASLFVRHIPGYISRSFPTFKDEDDDDGDGDRQYLAALLFPAASTNYRGLLAPPASPAAVVSFNGTTRRTFSPLSISHVRSTI
ncbi:hypothetical protein MPTK1_2g25220 [Marchantia polymorpha subsp. ruderalis]|uniref:Uncharacterized protein n=1 Tax=Marchantia polymorpha TaxID=3197 RepID=A0A2R6W362_MARPO|nr:hypothetical protein MARPO_0168s0011 [Marchantia polymorpha]BBN03654.1 hypothetical protein Mp_2g25220 [Marchantia polymorpha subsp. ruderalis]|eukprot:PTQ28287.1 hypothetical protein MARPO_0168s0011 [Marchantia polymorpha]